MKWNFYFSTTAIVIQIILLWFYNYSQVLPLKKNKMFYRILTLSVITCFLNLISVYFDLHVGFQYVTELTVTSILYYALFVLVFFELFEYGMFYLGFEDCLKTHRILYRIPLWAFLVIEISSYWTHNLFYIDLYGNFAYGKAYDVFYFVLGFYSLLLFYYQHKAKKRLSNTKRLPIKVCLMTLALGIFCDYASDTAILTDIFLSTSELILYITLENPDFYRSHITKTYNTEGFVRFTDELLKKGTPFYITGFHITNIQNLRKHHGTRNLFRALTAVGKWFKKSFPETYVFYPDNDCFLLLSATPIDTAHFTALCKKRFLDPFTCDSVKIFIRGNMFLFDAPEKFSGGSALLATISLTGPARNADIHHITDDDRLALLEETKLEKILQKHILDGTIDVYYQPLFSVKSGKIEGAEALARMNDPETGFVPPGKFIPLAEKNGTIMEMGLQIFEKVCLFVSTCDLKASGLQSVNVNLSPLQFQDIRLVDTLEAIAQKHRVDFSIFNFEITETSLANNDLIEHQVSRLKARGASVSLDDFGTGSSNLARLTSFPFTESKLDMSLVWNYFETKNPIMEDVITIFKNQGLKIVAEGVETEEMAKALSRMDCDYLQGYYFSRPLPEQDFRSFITTFNA